MYQHLFDTSQPTYFWASVTLAGLLAAKFVPPLVGASCRSVTGTINALSHHAHQHLRPAHAARCAAIRSFEAEQPAWVTYKPKTNDTWFNREGDRYLTLKRRKGRLLNKRWFCESRNSNDHTLRTGHWRDRGELRGIFSDGWTQRI